jgi:M6 family metalloprotease-like protein
MQHIQKALLSFAICALSTATVGAMPAFPVAATVEQPDGSVLTVELRGDEFNKISTTTDGLRLINNCGTFYYATANSHGEATSTNIQAHNAAERSVAEAAFVATLPRTFTLPESNRQHAAARRRLAAGPTQVNGATFPTTGTPHTIVILVEFPDLKFVTDNAAGTFSDMLNKSGYDQREHIGCAADYFRQQSGNRFSPTFDVYGPVTASKSAYYYGENDDNGDDYRAPELVAELCRALDDEIDFSRYDNDGDGLVDNVYFYYAGYGENFAGSRSDRLWPHSWYLDEGGIADADATFDGVRVRSYGCCAELYGTTGSDTASMGTFVHEFSHILGIPDFYDSNYDVNGTSYHPSYWDVMASGSYLPLTRNSGAVPPGYNGLERMMLGWGEPVEITQPQTITLDPLLSDVGIFLRINTPNDNEFYIVENRQCTRQTYDYYLPYHGMLVWHVDQRPEASISFGNKQVSCAEAWDLNVNAVNADATHMCFELIKATGNGSSKYSEETPFPGSQKITSFTDATTPSMKSWAGLECNAPITDITELNRQITFNFMGGAEPRNVVALDADNVTDTTFAARWQPLDGIDNYILNVWQWVYTPVSNAVTNSWAFTSQPNDWTISGSYQFENDDLTLSGTKAATLTSIPFEAEAGAKVRLTAKQYAATESGFITVTYGDATLGTIIPTTNASTFTFTIPEGVSSPASLSLSVPKGKRVVVQNIEVEQSTILRSQSALPGYPCHVQNATSFAVPNLMPDTDYGYQVSAAGLASSQSNVITVTTGQGESAALAATAAAGNTPQAIADRDGNITISGVSAPTIVSVYDLLGRTMLPATTVTAAATTLPLHLPNGIYVVAMQCAGKNTIQKLLTNHL